MVGAAKKVISEDLDCELKEFVEGVREKGLRVSRKMLSRKSGVIFNHLKAERKITE